MGGVCAVSRLVVGHAGQFPDGCLLWCLNAAMTRDDVHRLRGEGLSVRAIAARLGLTKTKVHRWLTAGPEFDGDGDGLALLDGDEVNLTPPFEFVGLDDDGSPRWVDSRGVYADPLNLYRYCTHRANEHEDGWEWHRQNRADMDRQLCAAGVVRALIAYGRHAFGDVWAYRYRDELGPEFELLDPEEIRWHFLFGVIPPDAPHYLLRREPYM
jgi:hypothetical protein